HQAPGQAPRHRQAWDREAALLHVRRTRRDVGVDPRLQGEAVTMTATQPTVAPTLPGRSNQAALIVHGADRPGIVAAVSATLSQHGANIVSLDQYTDNPEGGQFFQ